MLHTKYRYSDYSKSYFGQLVKVYSSETEYEYHFIEDKYNGLDVVIDDINDASTIGILVAELEDGREIYSNDTINFYIKHDGHYNNCRLVYSAECLCYLIFDTNGEQVDINSRFRNICMYPNFYELTINDYYK